MADGKNAESPNTNDRNSFTSLLLQLKNVLIEFVRTRAKLLVSELRDRVENSKKSAMFAGVALICGSVACLLLTLAAVGLVAVAFWGSPFTFFWGFLIIGICYLLLGSITAIMAHTGFKRLAPQKTIEVRHDDQTWVRGELTRPSTKGTARYAIQTDLPR